MLTIGIIYCGFGDSTHAEVTAKFWTRVRDRVLANTHWIISGISVPFKGYENEPLDFSTTELLKSSNFNYLFHSKNFYSESEARNIALKNLLGLKQKCDFIFLVDSDEFFTDENVENIVNFIQKDRFTTWFSFSYKNYVFDENTYLEEPFTPPRAFRVDAQTHDLTEFYHDNEVYYTGKMTDSKADFKQFSSRNIPQSVAWIRHLTWPSNERGRLKVQYQAQRWGADMCSYRWNNAASQLEFNPDYYQKFGKSIPKLMKD